MARLTHQDFERLLEFRVTLRLQRWSEDQAKAGRADARPASAAGGDQWRSRDLAATGPRQSAMSAHLDRLHELATVLDES